MSMKPWSSLYRYLLTENGQDFLFTRYDWMLSSLKENGEEEKSRNLYLEIFKRAWNAVICFNLTLSSMGDFTDQKQKSSERWQN